MCPQPSDKGFPEEIGRTETAQVGEFFMDTHSSMDQSWRNSGTELVPSTELEEFGHRAGAQHKPELVPSPELQQGLWLQKGAPGAFLCPQSSKEPARSSGLVTQGRLSLQEMWQELSCAILQAPSHSAGHLLMSTGSTRRHSSTAASPAINITFLGCLICCSSWSWSREPA